MSESTGTGRSTTEPIGKNAHESYSFACMRCGYGWEQSYEIEHHLDADGKPFVVYFAGGQRVPSPLSEPSCGNCDGHVVRILRPGRVSTARNSMHFTPPPRPAVKPGRKSIAESLAESLPEAPVSDRGAEPAHHWHLSDLLHPFHRRTQ